MSGFPSSDFFNYPGWGSCTASCHVSPPKQHHQHHHIKLRTWLNSLSSSMNKCLLLMQRGQVVGVVLWVSGVGNHSDDGAFQRSAPQQPLADQVHVPRRVHAEPDGGAREEHPFVGQQQRETARYLNSSAGGHCRLFSEASSLFTAQLPQHKHALLSLSHGPDHCKQNTSGW